MSISSLISWALHGERPIHRGADLREDAHATAAVVRSVRGSVSIGEIHIRSDRGGVHS
jgi:hypothetical protein